MKIALVDLSAPQDLKILLVKTGGVSTVLSAHQLAVEDGGDPLALVAGQLASLGSGDLTVAIIPPADLVADQVFHFPPMPEREIRKVLPREVAGAAGQPGPFTIDYQLSGTVVEKGAEKIEVHAFYGVQESLAAFVRRAMEAGLPVSRIVPDVIGFNALLDAVPELMDEKEGLLLAEVRDGRISLHLFKGRHWALDREFAFRSEAGAEPEAEDLQRIVLETSRTLQFFKQKFRGFPVSRAVIFGAHQAVPAIQKAVADSLAVPVVRLSLDRLKGKLSLPRSVVDGDEFLGLFARPLFVALALGRKRVLDLFPAGFEDRRQKSRRRFFAALTLGALLVGLAGATLYFEGIRNSYRREVKATQATYFGMDRRVAEIEAVKAQRADVFRIRQFIDGPRRYADSLAELVREITLAATDDLRIDEFDAEPAGETARFTLRGVFQAGDGITAQSAFLRFFGRLKEAPGVVDLLSGEVKIAPPPPAAETTAETVGISPPLELRFQLTGQLELE